jgi:hypothetical protein
MIHRILRRAPHTGYTKLAATALSRIEWAINPAPRIASSLFDAPAMRFRVPQCFFNFLLLML